MTPRRILIAGWVVFVLYAYPGYMSYDSVLQLLQARDGVYTGGHPAMMGVLWGLVDAIFAGPFGMLVIQSTCFLAGAYLIFRRVMSDRTAALCSAALLWFPPISAVLAVIWKDSQMVAFLALGAGLLLDDRRNVRLGGLALLFLATGMRYNALAITLPLIVLLFEWERGYRWYKRYAIAVAAWLAVTAGANTLNTRLVTTTNDIALWHNMALFDITGTLRYAPELSDDELRRDLEGTPLLRTSSIQVTARATHPADSVPADKVLTFGMGVYIPGLWVTTLNLFDVPPRVDQRAAVERAWRSIVLGNPGAYLEYRWHVTKERIGLGTEPVPSAYIWFNDVLDIEGSRLKTEHSALPSKLQVRLQAAMQWLGASSLFRPWIYLALLLVLMGFAWRDRTTLALALAGLANEAALFLLAPTVDYRYSVWLVVATVVVLLRVIARRARPGAHNASD